jgi:hypothetical protein
MNFRRILYVNSSIRLPISFVAFIDRSASSDRRMNTPRPVDLHGARVKAEPLSTPVSKKVVIGFLATLIVSAMIAWLGLLGWGMVEILRSVAACIRGLWTTFF